MNASVEIRNVDKIYPGATEVTALKGINLSIEDGSFIAMLGPSGCGKSTLLNIIAGFEESTNGSVTFCGQPITRPGPDRAVVFQEPALFPWLSVWQNVTFGPRMQRIRQAEYEAKAREYLDIVGLGSFADHLPNQLSGGMKQRVGLARCLIMQPKMFLMDEPFGALDAQTRLEMQELLLQVWERNKRPVLFITHDIDEAILLADTVCVMSARPGRIERQIKVPLSRPRDRGLLTDSAFNELRRELMDLLREQATRSRDGTGATTGRNVA